MHLLRPRTACASLLRRQHYGILRTTVLQERTRSKLLLLFRSVRKQTLRINRLAFAFETSGILS